MCKCFGASARTEENVAWTAWHQANWSPWGTALELFILLGLFYLFFSSFLLLFIRFEPAVRSVAPRSAVVVELFASAEAGGEGNRKGKIKKKKRCEAFFKSPVSLGARSPQTGFKKAKSFIFGKWQGAGNSRGQRSAERKFNKDGDGRRGLGGRGGGGGGGGLIDCFLSALQSVLSCLRPLRRPSCLFLYHRSRAAVSGNKALGE